MSVEDMFGNLRVCSFCEEGGGRTTTIDGTAGAAVHGIEVENWGTAPYDIEVEIELPQHPALLDFATSGDRWTYQGRSLAPNDLQQQDCGLQGLGGTGNERIHVVRVFWKKAGKPRWKPASGNCPMSLSVSVR